MPADRRQFLQGGFAGFVAILAGRLPSSPPPPPVPPSNVGELEAIIKVDDTLTPALQEAAAAAEEFVEKQQQLAEAVDVVRLSLEGCREITVFDQHRPMLDVTSRFDDYDQFMPAGPMRTELELEFWPGFPRQNVIELLCGDAQVEIDCSPLEVPATIRGYLVSVDKHAAGPYSDDGCYTRITLRGAGEVVWHG